MILSYQVGRNNLEDKRKDENDNMENAILREYFEMCVREKKLDTIVVMKLAGKYNISCDKVREITEVVRTYRNACQYLEIIKKSKGKKAREAAYELTADTLKMDPSEVKRIIKEASRK